MGLCRSIDRRVVVIHLGFPRWGPGNFYSALACLILLVVVGEEHHIAATLVLLFLRSTTSSCSAYILIHFF